MASSGGNKYTIGSGLAKTPSGTKIPKPSAGAPANPFFAQAAGKSWNEVQSPGPWTPTSAPVRPPVATAAPYVPAHNVTTTSSPPPPDLSGNNWQGYLNPDQLQGLYNAGDTYAQGMAQYGPQGPTVTGAQANYAQEMQNAQYSHDVGHRDAAENLAARGMLQSGVAAGDFADLDRSLTMRQAGATSSLNTVLLGAQNAIDSLNRVWGHAQIVGQGQAALDAAALAPTTPVQQTTTVPASGTPPTAPGATAPPAGTNPFFAQAAGKPWNPGQPGGAKIPKPAASKPPAKSFSSGPAKRVK